MARTAQLGKVQEAVSIAAEAALRRVPVEEVIDERRTTRRTFLKEAGALGIAAAGATAFGRLAPLARAAGDLRIVVVGAGLAGLTCAYRLKQAGLTAQLYEASSRLGGRCWTIRDAFDDGQIGEHGGELIDQGHTQTRQLAQELGFDLDHLSIVGWIEESVPGGIASKLGQLLDDAYNIEYGAESSVQSSLNLIYLLAYTGPGQLRLFGHSNEKYHVRGGNDQIPQRLAEALAGQIATGLELVSIKLNSDGSTYTLSFKDGSATRAVVADQVVLALPFSILRSSVNYSKAGFEPLKATAIQELGMGTNSKLHVQFSRRGWNELRCNGETYADTGYQSTWEVSRAQAGVSGILVDYTGGNVGASFDSGTTAARAEQFLAQLEPVLPGISALWNGRATRDFWPGDPWTKGSYSYWKVGQYTKFAGIERRRQGNCHFAGEHTSIDFQGYLNGAVESGERAAAEILGDLK
jgi:monoamine oxidase